MQWIKRHEQISNIITCLENLSHSKVFFHHSMQQTPPVLGTKLTIYICNSQNSYGWIILQRATYKRACSCHLHRQLGNCSLIIFFVSQIKSSLFLFESLKLRVQFVFWNIINIPQLMSYTQILFLAINYIKLNVS